MNKNKKILTPTTIKYIDALLKTANEFGFAISKIEVYGGIKPNSVHVGLYKPDGSGHCSVLSVTFYDKIMWYYVDLLENKTHDIFEIGIRKYKNGTYYICHNYLEVDTIQKI